MVLYLEFIQLHIQTIGDWIYDHLLNWQNIMGLVVIGLLFLVSRYLEPTLKKTIKGLLPKLQFPLYQKLKHTAGVLSFYLIFCAFLWLLNLAVIIAELSVPVVHITTGLLSAWIIIQFLSSFLKNSTLAKLFSFFIWAVTALKIINVYDEFVSILDSIALQTGELRLSLLTIINGAILLFIFLTLSQELSNIFNKKITRHEALTPSVQILLKKIFRITVFSISILIVLGSLGIDLTAFTVLGGTIGLGLGFGLQKVVANFISGIIILIDKSIKPGDVIQIGEVYGEITALGSRFVSVVTREGKEYLIPNEEFITSQVINWSYSDRKIRIKTRIGVSYGSNVNEVMEIMLNIADEIERVLKVPKPKCFISGFGDSAIDMVLNFWIENPEDGIANVRSEVLLGIWEAFQEKGIEIPFPQRDLHIKEQADDISSDS